ncbi:hypothetical protein NLJ89_g8938 [Agrocybe chaxingu]|uniref:Uncharacterized protein n=1 Tax=Agrocybe chaxingu TaxID=84603 RepID=A0A9W8K0X7_9AGAR|nr:hypothetical protein NLJ89_g8938 [Agrocybe chaxingu]
MPPLRIPLKPAVRHSLALPTQVKSNIQSPPLQHTPVYHLIVEALPIAGSCPAMLIPSARHSPISCIIPYVLPFAFLFFSVYVVSTQRASIAEGFAAALVATVNIPWLSTQSNCPLALRLPFSVAGLLAKFTSPFTHLCGVIHDSIVQFLPLDFLHQLNTLDARLTTLERDTLGFQLQLQFNMDAISLLDGKIKAQLTEVHACVAELLASATGQQSEEMQPLQERILAYEKSLQSTQRRIEHAEKGLELRVGMVGRLVATQSTYDGAMESLKNRLSRAAAALAAASSEM